MTKIRRDRKGQQVFCCHKEVRMRGIFIGSVHFDVFLKGGVNCCEVKNETN